MKISVVMPVRNGERFLPTALESIVGQERKADQIVLVLDATSTDDTVATGHELAAAVDAVVTIQERPGVAAAINQGITATDGDVVAMLSCDDMWTPDALALHEQALLGAPDAGYSIGLVRYFVDPDTGPPPGWRAELLDSPRRARMIETTMVRRSVFALVGLHRPVAGASSDVDFFARAHDAGVTSVDVDRVVVHKRVHTASTAHTSTTATADLLAVARDAIRRKSQDGDLR